MLPTLPNCQRTDSLYVTISLSEVKNEKVDLTATQLTFKGESQGKEYNVVLEFFGEVETEGSIVKVLGPSVQLLLSKKVKGEEFWPRLLKDKALEKNGVTLDWDRCVWRRDRTVRRDITSFT